MGNSLITTIGGPDGGGQGGKGEMSRVGVSGSGLVQDHTELSNCWNAVEHNWIRLSVYYHMVEYLYKGSQ